MFKETFCRHVSMIAYNYSCWKDTNSSLKCSKMAKVVSLTDLLKHLTKCKLYVTIHCKLQLHYSSRQQISCFKVTEGLQPPYSAAPNHQYSVASFARVLVLSCLHSSGLRCSRCNVIRFCCDPEACNLVTAIKGNFTRYEPANSLAASKIA
jgi:hypothetical protein